MQHLAARADRDIAGDDGRGRHDGVRVDAGLRPEVLESHGCSLASPPAYRPVIWTEARATGTKVVVAARADIPSPGRKLHCA
ncbi:hypothetical protein MSA03_03400 [Microbacterium saccharophilum]|nr:hypothetical protein MSA03_03400 [Microbacterium saccharophilum]